MDTILLNKSDVGSLIDLDKVQEAVEDGYRSFSSGKVVQPDFMNIVKPGTHTGFDFKGGLDLGGGFISIKSSSGGYPDNPKLGLPTGLNMVYLYEADTSALKCIMDGTWITGCRTAAAGAISVKYLARENADKIAMIGAGNQARRQLRAILRVRDIKEVYVWSYTKESVEQYCKEMSEETGLSIKACESAKEAVEQADIIVTTTRGRKGPVVKREWVKPGTHIAAIGSDMPDKQELDTDLFPGAKVVDDSIAFCLKNGETHHAVEEGVIPESAIYGEIGEILLGEKPGRENDEEITIFDTVGMAIQDNVMASAIYKQALEKGLGIKFDFLK
jgi:alanine dehydrogenase